MTLPDQNRGEIFLVPFPIKLSYSILLPFYLTNLVEKIKFLIYTN